MEQKFLSQARDAGWHVIAMTVDSSFSHSQQLPANKDGETALALRIDNHLADRAYALESMDSFLRAERPELLLRPTVLVGVSAGAIAVPTVAARTGPPDAAVLVAGGENVADIIIESPLFAEHTQLVEPGDGNRAEGERFEPVTDAGLRSDFARNAFAQCRLDPARTAPSLSSTPTLMLHAKYDNIVPSHTGDDLFKSLGEPERWSYRIGHAGLCAMLPWKANQILKWLDAVTLASRPEEVAARPPL